MLNNKLKGERKQGEHQDEFLQELAKSLLPQLVYIKEDQNSDFL